MELDKDVMEYEEPRVVFEDSDVLVVNKPSGLVVHGDGRTKEHTLADWLLAIYPELRGVGEPWTSDTGEVLERPGIVHRLDRDTSGVLVVAKHQSAYEYLKEQFGTRQVRKEYRAVVYGVLSDDGGVINKPIGKSTSDFRRWSAQRGARGTLRDARTEYSVLARGGVGQDGWSYIAVFPITGRTHQIRVHLKAIHHPVVCDMLYAPKKMCLLGFDRLALHAYRITLMVPTGIEQTFEASLPELFKKLDKNDTE